MNYKLTVDIDEELNCKLENRQREVERCKVKLSKLKSEWRLMKKNDFDYKSKKQEVINLERHISDMEQRNGVLKSFLDF